MGETLQSTRQLYILQILNEAKDGLSITDIHKKVSQHLGEVTSRTIRRDIEQLSSEYNIHEVEDTTPIRYVVSKFSIKQLQLSAQDLYSLTMTQALLKEHVMDHTYLHASSILESILVHSTQFDKDQLEDMRQAFLIRKSATSEKDLDIAIVNRLFHAIKKHRPINVKYHGFTNDAKTERIIHPYFFVVQESKLHLIAYCTMRNGIRDFRVSRIVDFLEINDLFDRDEAAISDYEKKRFVHLSGGKAQDIKLLFNQQMARYIQEYECEKADKLELQGEGQLLFIKHVGITDELIRWVLSFGEAVKVLEPAELKDIITVKIKEMIRHYE